MIDRSRTALLFISKKQNCIISYRLKFFTSLEHTIVCWVFRLFCVSCRMVMEEGGQRDRGRGTPATAGAEGRQIFVELGEWPLTLNISLTWPLQGTQDGFVFLLFNPVAFLCLFVLCFKMQAHICDFVLFSVVENVLKYITPSVAHNRCLKTQQSL